MKTIEQTVLKFIKEKDLFKPGDKILAALSGGPDSVFLSYFLNKFKKKLRIEITAFHVNHKLRGKSSDDDEHFCKEFTDNLKLEFSSVTVNVGKAAERDKISIEEAGRELRYFELQKYSKKYNFNKIATAHTADDNAETVFLNLIKGTGLKGISGIPVVRENIVRPLLPVTKSEILNYLNENEIKFRIDTTNLSSVYQRNFIRNEIIPLIKSKLNPSLEESLFNSSELFREYYSHLLQEVETLSKQVLKVTKEGIFISNKMEGISKAIQRELIKTAIERNFFVQSTFNDIKNLELLITQQKGKKINLANGLNAVKEKDGILIKKETIESYFPLTRVFVGKENHINGFKLLILPEEDKSIKFSINGSNEFISADGIYGPLFVRKWEEGDRFIPLGMKGYKKISDFLTDKNLTSSEKKKQLVLINKNRIVWVIGLRIDERFKITKTTKTILHVCITY
jgi:tRNA(Ile)-lysidine synthase